MIAPPGTPHRVAVLQAPWEHFWIHFVPRTHWLDFLDWKREPLGIRLLTLPKGPQGQELVQLIKRAVCFTMAARPNREHFALNTLEMALLLCADLVQPVENHQFDGPTNLCLEFISTHLSDQISLSELARISGQSVSRMTKKFREATNMSPNQYLEQQRLQRAIDLLTVTDIPIQAVAEEVGFQSPFYFTLRFRKHTGFGPRDFRKMARQTQGILRRPNLRLNADDHRAIQTILASRSVPGPGRANG